MIEQHNHWQDFVEWIHEHWPIISGMVVTIIGGFWLILHKTFPTHEKMELCKSDLDARIDKHELWEQEQHNKAAHENATQHREIREEVGHVRREVGDLKNLLIRNGDK